MDHGWKEGRKEKILPHGGLVGWFSRPERLAGGQEGHFPGAGGISAREGRGMKVIAGVGGGEKMPLGVRGERGRDAAGLQRRFVA
jgi:hypothetical protein